MMWRVREGGSSAQAIPVSRRATRPRSVALVSSRIASSSSISRSGSSRRARSRTQRLRLPFHLEPEQGHGELLAHIYGASMAGLWCIEPSRRECTSDSDVLASEVHVVPRETQGFAQPHSGSEERKLDQALFDTSSR